MRSIFYLTLTLGLGCVSLSCDKCETTEPIDDCFCIQVYDPVCGCDGVTYGNSCQANCAGVPEYEPRECGK